MNGVLYKVSMAFNGMNPTNKKTYVAGKLANTTVKGILYKNRTAFSGLKADKMTVGQSTYLFRNGAMVKNKYVKSQWGNYYFFGADGKIGTDVVRMNGTYYYFDHKTYLMHKNTYDKSRRGTWYILAGMVRPLVVTSIGMVSCTTSSRGRTRKQRTSTFMKMVTGTGPTKMVS